MMLHELLQAYGFSEHPFGTVAAEKEVLLDKYFLEPRYFPEVLGSARNPRCYVVFGPRGGGKSAIRTMVERIASGELGSSRLDGRVLCVTYDDYSFVLQKPLSKISLTDHVNEMLKLATSKLCAMVIEHGTAVDLMDKTDRAQLRWYLQEYLERITPLELSAALSRVSSRFERVRDMARSLGTAGVNIYNYVARVLKTERIEPVSPSSTDHKEQLNDVSCLFVLSRFIELLRKLGFDALYVLVDKIDETDVTGGSADKAAALVRPMITNIRFLETEGLAIKFFLWSDIKRSFGSELRADRVPMKDIVWSDEDLREMLRRRLRAYGNDDITLASISDADMKPVIEDIVIYLSYKSPRDSCRLMDYVLAEQAALATYDHVTISRKAFELGAKKFCEARVRELYTVDTIHRIQRIRKTEFLTRGVAAAFKTSDQTARNYIRAWQDSGAIEQIESVLVEGARRPVYQYRVRDPRLRHLVLNGGIDGLLDDLSPYRQRQGLQEIGIPTDPTSNGVQPPARQTRPGASRPAGRESHP